MTVDVDQYFREEFTRRDWQTVEEGTVRMAVVGLGGFARNRALPAIRDGDFTELSVLVSGSPDKAASLADEFNAETVLDYESFTDGDATDEYDAVYVATPPAYHAEYAVAAAEFGKHVLCEKPLAADSESGERMVAACDDAGVILMTAYRLRTEPALRRMREAVRDGVIGEPVQIQSGFTSKVLEDVGPNTWRLDPEIAGGGALIDLGVYPLNTSRFLLGTEPVAVQAETYSSGPPFDRVDEHASFLVTFPSGVTAACAASFDAQRDNFLRVLGTDGLILLREPFSGTVAQEIVIERGDARTQYTGAAIDEVREEFDYFAHCVLAGTVCETDGEAGCTDLRIVDAAYEAAETGERVSLDLDYSRT
ncbi:D-xylose 1-dehydrogenase Gfo6 [Halomicrobium urmianum]|uniref:D-xylose 1-dehydrogenase Gfo6 n=1 Tax=Halomicrobium urmianum TaxID=1586233 RepID=UPI001CDA353C|nr:D-xylose 1-dehydrogenase Gfo6 [Halomicrobium urmianum]